MVCGGEVSWAHGITPDGRDVGYAIETVCEHPGCDEKIDRGLYHCCGGMHGKPDELPCRRYFCGEHLFFVLTRNPEVDGAVCEACYKALDEACDICGEEFKGDGRLCHVCIAEAQ